LGFMAAVLGVAVPLLCLVAAVVPEPAQAQYRAGSFVNGQPYFAPRRRRAARTYRRRAAARRNARRLRRLRKRAAARSRRAATRQVTRAAPQQRTRASNKPRAKKPQATKRKVGPPEQPTKKAAAARIPQLPQRRGSDTVPPAGKTRLPLPLPVRIARASADGAAAPRKRPTPPAQAVSLLRPPEPPAKHKLAPPTLPKKRRRVHKIVVSLKQQRLTVYEDGRPVRRAPISSGKAGHRTPRGIFSVIQKRRYHRSNIYSNAPMPYMQRLTWSGIALHQGRLPGYAASHGCIRLPGRFARTLFRSTRLRTHVVVARSDVTPKILSHPNLPAPTTPAAGDQDQRLTGLAPWPRARIARRAVSTVRPPSRVAGWQETAAPPETVPETSSALRQVLAELAVHRPASGYVEMAVDKTTAVQPEQPAEERPELSGPLRILVTRRTVRDHHRDVQRQLAAMDYDVGEIDGRLGRQMIGALKAFQKDQELPLTGLPDEATRERLDSASGIARPSAATIYVRQQGEPVYSGAVAIADFEQPLGTHLYILLDADHGDRPAWTALTAAARGRLPGWSRRTWLKRRDSIPQMTARAALDRMTLSPALRLAIEDRLIPGSSLIIADRGSERETGMKTDFVVLTD